MKLLLDASLIRLALVLPRELPVTREVNLRRYNERFPGLSAAVSRTGQGTAVSILSGWLAQLHFYKQINGELG